MSKSFVLSNGVRVVSKAIPGHFSTLGVYIDAGSRYEHDNIRGTSHLIDRLSFKVRKYFIRYKSHETRQLKIEVQKI